MIKFEIGGRRINPNRVKDPFVAAVLERISAEIREKVGAIRDPETGEFPTVVVRGKSIESLSMNVEGSPEIIALVKRRLGIGESDEERGVTKSGQMPKAFLSYTSDNLALAQRIAELLHKNGIETWWDKWCINAGDSLRQRIDEGLSGCTHFLVLLTPQSIGKPWVNQEMDAALVRKLNNECKFLPVRYQLPVSELPPLLAGLHAPEIAADEDITQLINDIHGISRKPPLGPVPQTVVQGKETNTGYSAAANKIAQLFVERSKYGRFADPQFSIENIARETGLTVSDVEDGLYELSDYLKGGVGYFFVKSSLFSEFDKYWKSWVPADDALKLAADISNDKNFPADCKQIADLYGWDPRRLNPAISYLFERGMLVDYHATGVPQFEMVRVVGKEGEIRRFVKSRR